MLSSHPWALLNLLRLRILQTLTSPPAAPSSVLPQKSERHCHEPRRRRRPVHVRPWELADCAGVRAGGCAGAAGRAGSEGGAVMLHSYENRTWRTERRKAWPRILGWIVMLLPFALLMLLTFNM